MNFLNSIIPANINDNTITHINLIIAEIVIEDLHCNYDNIFISNEYIIDYYSLEYCVQKNNYNSLITSLKNNQNEYNKYMLLREILYQTLYTLIKTNTEQSTCMYIKVININETTALFNVISGLYLDI